MRIKTPVQRQRKARCRECSCLFPKEEMCYWHRHIVCPDCYRRWYEKSKIGSWSKNAR